ncbi:hypothetical protein [Roseovarius sp. E0-M6]|uniref:hypothetical protein n=1 Tax=Roseovarius sp. E0-M6 TaxID=3127118 RepID=UPI00300FCE19
MLLVGVVVLLVTVWLCAYGAVRTGRFYVFYTIALLPIPVAIGLSYSLFTAETGLSPLTLILSAMAVAAVFYPVNVWRLRLER